MKTRMKLVAVTVAGALAAAEPGLAAVMVVPRAARTAPVPIAPGAILAPAGGIPGSLLTLSAPLTMPGAWPTLPTAAVLRPGTGPTPPAAAAASNPVLSTARAALPRAAAAVRAQEGATAAAEGMTPAGPAPLLREARTGFRERLASLSRGIQGMVAPRAVSERFGTLGRLFDSSAGQGTFQAPAPAVDAEAARPADPRWGERLWERLRDGADPALFGPIRDAINEHPADKQSGYALQYLYFFPIDMALPVLKEHLDGPFREQVLMALKSYAVLAANPAQRRSADLHIYGEMKGMLPSNHALVDPEIEAAILKIFKGVTPKQQALFFAGDERTYAMDLMAVIPNRAFAAAAQQYLNENWLDAEWLYEGVAADGGRIPSNPFSWLQGALDIAAAQADAGDAPFLAALGARLKGRLGEIRKAREDRYESLAKAGKLYLGWYKPYDRRLESLARVHAAVLRAIAAVQPAGGKAAPGSPSRLFAGAATANAGGRNAVDAEREQGYAVVPEPAGGPERGGSAGNALRKMNALALAGAFTGALLGPLVPAAFLLGGLLGSGLADAALMAADARWRIFDHPAAGTAFRAAAMATAFAFFGASAGLLTHGLGAVFGSALASAGAAGAVAGGLVPTLVDGRSSRQAIAPLPVAEQAIETSESPAEAGHDSEASSDVPASPAPAVPAPVETDERRASSAHALRLTNAVVAVGTLAGTIAALYVPAPFLGLAAAGAGLLILSLTALDALWAVYELPYAGWVLRAVGGAAALVFVTGIVGIIVLPS